VFLAEDHELPLVRGTLLMRGGQRAAPPSAVGMLHCPLVQAYHHLSAFCLRRAALAEQAAHAAALGSRYVNTLLHCHRVTPMCMQGAPHNCKFCPVRCACRTFARLHVSLGFPANLCRCGEPVGGGAARRRQHCPTTAIGHLLNCFVKAPLHFAGVASLSAAVQRAGGSTALPGDQLDEALEQVAAYIEVGDVMLAATKRFRAFPAPVDTLNEAVGTAPMLAACSRRMASVSAASAAQPKAGVCLLWLPYFGCRKLWLPYFGCLTLAAERHT